MKMPRRKTYSNREKIRILDVIADRQEGGEVSLRACCRDLQVQASQVRRWQNMRDELAKPESCHRHSQHTGRPSLLDPLGQDLMRWFFELREQGFMVSVRLVVLKACELSPAFRRKGARAKDMSVRRFLAKNKIVLRAVTHECQRPPQAVRQDALDFIRFAQPKVSGVNRSDAYVLNMDQTPIFFDMSTGRTLSAAGERTVNGRTSSSSTLRVTVAVSVTASGNFLKPLVVFKGKPGARIETREFPTYPDSNFYACQERAWMDERVMRKWIRLVLRPYVETAPPNIDPIIFLDSYRCHMMAPVVDEIQQLGVEVIHIPGGCTGLCQPVDIGIAKPLKSRSRHLWESWMIDQGVNSVVSRPPSRLQLSQWITESAEQIRESPTIVKNSWRHGEYSYFPTQTRNEQGELQGRHQEASAGGVEQGGQGNDHDELMQPPEEEEQSQGEDEEEDVLLPAVPAQQPARPDLCPPELCRDPGWDDTDDSDYAYSGSSSD